MNYMNDPNIQLYLMQQTGYSGFPGLGMPGPGGNNLAATANMHGPAVFGAGSVDTSPLAPFGLHNYGLPGQLLGAAGNIYLSQRLQQAGLISTGNAASMQQAIDARQMQTTQLQVMNGVASQDAANIYQFFRGSAAIAGVPMTSSQRFAAQQMAGNIAQQSPMISMLVPGGSEFLDMMSGPSGSVQAMASQMMEANRYRIDPVTGKYGLGADANTGLIKNVFSNMFAADNIPRMQGLRAGDVGQIYRTLSAEGLAGPTTSLRNRTLDAIEAARQTGVSAEDLANGTGVSAEALSGNLNGLSNAQLGQLRKNSSVQEQLTKADAQQISSQLQEYVGAISAMREVFGEAGNPNAPVPQLIGALKALTGGQMQKFDPASLANMVRDMQAMSQMSGKSVDQLLAMSQTANSMNTTMLGSHAANFNPATMAAGVAGGMAFSQAGGATGFGALNRQQAEQATMSLFSRGLGSETSQAMGALLRVRQAGGFSNNAAGQQLQAIMNAAAAGEDTYTFNGTTHNMPTKLTEFRSLAAAGGLAGGDANTFNMMLTDTTANMRALAENPEMQQVAFQQQRREINQKLNQVMGSRLSGETVLRTGIPDNAQRVDASRAISAAGLDALNTLSPAEMQNPELRIGAMAEAIRAEAATYNVTMSDEQARAVAAGQFGQAEQTVKSYGFESFTAYSQVHGGQVSQARNAAQQAAAVRSSVNESMAKMQGVGGVQGRIGSAIMRQADRAAGGQPVNMDTLLQDVFGGAFLPEQQQISGPLAKVQAAYEKARALESQFAEASTPEERQRLQEEAKQIKTELDTAIEEAGSAIEVSGLGAAQNLAKLTLGNYDEDAKKLGMTPEQYLEAVKSGKMPSSLLAISDKEVLAKAKNAESIISSTDRDISRFDADLQSKDPEVRRRASASVAAIRAKREVALRDRNAGMLAMGLTPGDPKDEAEYKKQLANQGSIGLLEKRAKDYEAGREALRSQGLSEKDIDNKIEESVKLEQTARDNEAEAQARVLPTEELNTLADAFGLETSDDRKSLAEKLKTEEGDSSANQKMLATVLKRLDKNKNVDGANAIEKLDSLTDKYAEAKGDPEKLKQLAKSYNMSVGDLNKMMQQTEFLGMREETGTYTQEKLAKEMSAVAGRDIAAETASESASTQHITGEIRVTGDVVNGTGTLQGVTTSLGS
jgi:hypothetical protein